MLLDILFFISLFWTTPVPSGQGWQADNTVVVSFSSNPDIACGGDGDDRNGIIGACADKIGGNHLTLPNPCRYKEHDAYARLACHELAHTNHWKHEYR